MKLPLSFQTKSSMEFFKEIRQTGYPKSDDHLVVFLDSCFEEVKLFVEHSSFRLSNARVLFRTSKKRDAQNEFNAFRELCLVFIESLNKVKSLISELGQNKKLDKLLLAAEEIIEKTTRRMVKSKIPLPEIDYLKTDAVTEFDIDWILKKMKNYWGKFLQVYGSLRIDIILSPR